MNSKISSGVIVSVETFYQPEYSNPIRHEFMFAYRISITKNNKFPVKLLRRHWHITEGNGIEREVEGEGVVGEQPIIGTGESFQYISGCNLDSEIGKMYGTYLMERLIDKKQFYVRIPEFQMVVPYKLN